MMTRYVLSPSAERDLEEIWEYIAKDDTTAANRVLEKIRDGIRKIAEMPMIGHFRADLPDASLRVWVVYSYLIIYQPEAKPLEVVRVIHGMRDVPNIF